MKTAFKYPVLVAALVAVLAAGGLSHAWGDSEDDNRKRAQKEMNDGNYKDAFELLEKLAMDPKADPMQVASDLNMGLGCLANLGLYPDMDDFREKVVKIHSDNWRLLFVAAQTLFQGVHYGVVVSGEFERGSHRGGGRYVNAVERDRVRALQLMEQAVSHVNWRGGTLVSALTGSKQAEIANFYLEFSRMLLGYRGYGEAWRLQYLTDLSELPDYEEGYGYHYYDSGTKGAPVDEDGNPVFHTVPSGYDEANTDGQRWRWLMLKAMEADPSRRNEVLRSYADFLLQQFGVQTMSYSGNVMGRQGDDGTTDESGIYALHTLNDDETIARLATGIKRFKLPEDANFIRLYEKLEAYDVVAGLYENRRLYAKAAKMWERAGYQDRVDQIVGNWGQFESSRTHPEGQPAAVEYRFRNGSAVKLEARKIKFEKLLKDVERYLKSNPEHLDWNRLDVNNIGYRLVNNDRKRYVGKLVTKWDLELKPRKNHFDKRITIKTPLDEPGAYLLTAKMKDGNTCHMIIWVDDTVIVRKPLDGGAYLFVADAVTGKPVRGAKVRFFGYRQEWIGHNKHDGRQYKVYTKRFSVKTDKNGQVVVKPKQFDDRYQWLITARTGSGRFAFMGYAYAWYGTHYDYEYNHKKIFAITDRPVYRPNQPVKFKFWVRHTRYDQEDVSTYAGHDFRIRITNPKGEKIFEEDYKADKYGGMDGDFLLEDEAMLGVYSVHIPGYGGTAFRVEEYKKPEFEVQVDAPDEPVMLGEKVAAKVQAKYYFGAPVTNAKVKYKVLRSNYSANWYPSGLWDWFYGPGYWWFAYDYVWYPGWRDWGMSRPHWWWWPASYTPPEVVADAEGKIGPDGTLEIEIDTAIAKEIHGNRDHRYEITVEVTDESRRTIVGQGAVLVARKPFKVYSWVDRGHYRTGDVIQASFSAQTLDTKPVKGKGKIDLYRVSYQGGDMTESLVQQWDLDTSDEGTASLQLKASEAGQYRLSYAVTDASDHTIEGAYVFVVRGEGFDGKQFRFNEIELVPDSKEYAPGDKVKLMINTDRAPSTVVLFLRPSNGIYLAPEVLRLKGKSTVHEIPVTKKDMPNFFVEAFTVNGGKSYSDTREIVVPPEERVINVEVLPSATVYKPGEKATVQVKITDFFGKPLVGSVVMSIYDRSVEYISGGSNVPEIRAFFWKWRRHHNPQIESSFDKWFSVVVPEGSTGMYYLGAFGHLVADQFGEDDASAVMSLNGGGGDLGGAAQAKMPAEPAAASPARDMAPRTSARKSSGRLHEGKMKKAEAENGLSGLVGQPGTEGPAAPTVRTKFADTAFWVGALETDGAGVAEIELIMPENLTGWKIRTWAMGHGTKVGESTVEVVTKKNLMLRLQAPRFFVEKDEVVLSANVHNYLKKKKSVRVVLELDGGSLQPMDAADRTVEIDANGEMRVDWRVKAVREGEAVVRMKALTDEESDAMEMRFPVFVHGILKTESFSGVIRADGDSAAIEIDVPVERRVDQSRLEIRYSPTLAGAMVDALPYLVSYPYGCTEQTLNRFLPTVITQKVLADIGVDLKDIQKKRSNLNAQEIGDDKERAKQWKRWRHNPVFDEKVVKNMVRTGLKRLGAMQVSDGGWGWFSGYGEYSYPHTTAYVVHGLQTAKAYGAKVDGNMLSRGIDWLERYQQREVLRLKNAEKKKRPYKISADPLDAFVYMVLADADRQNEEMREFIYRDRNNLAVYSKAMFGMALHRQGHQEKLKMIMRNIEQYLVEDAENQTAYLNLPNSGYWWYWYGSEYEAHAYYLKLLALTDPKSEKAAGLVKYLLNNRKHSTYWNSTRDTALCVEAMADYLKASGESEPDMTLDILVDGEQVKSVKINKDNLFTYDNQLLIEGAGIKSGKHTIELRRDGTGPVYFNAYLTNFTLEDYITKAGLEIKVDRKYFKLVKVDKTIKAAGSRGQAVDQKVEKFEREELKDLSELTSGDLVEIELTIKNKNDYEYIIFEDMKAAGFEPVEVRSGYNGNEMGAYMELRDERVVLFVRTLARGKHSVSYRMRAEIPGKFSALPTKAYAMYAPELKANSDEIKLKIKD